MSNLAPPWHKNPAPGVMKFKIFVDPTFIIIILFLVCLIYV